VTANHAHVLVGLAEILDQLIGGLFGRARRASACSTVQSWRGSMGDRVTARDPRRQHGGPPLGARVRRGAMVSP
jgi:hypothetical protein